MISARKLIVAAAVLAGACGSSGGGGAPDLGPAGGGDLGPVACTASVSGDVTQTFPPCKPTLCLVSGTNDTVFKLAVDESNLGLNLTAEVMGPFAVRGYGAPDLTADTNLQLVEDIASTMVIYRAVGGINPPAGQSLQMTLTSVTAPPGPCGGVAHGTIDATLLQESGSGMVQLHATF